MTPTHKGRPGVARPGVARLVVPVGMLGLGFPSESVARRIALGADVHADRATASYQDGILRVELPLARPAQRARMVTVEIVSRGAQR